MAISTPSALTAAREKNMAALSSVVAAIGLTVSKMIVGSLRLGRRTVAALIDTAPRGLAERIQAEVGTLPGVVDCHQVRVRTSGPATYVDLHVVLDGGQSLEATHALTTHIEGLTRQIAPGADVTVHAETPTAHQP